MKHPLIFHIINFIAFYMRDKNSGHSAPAKYEYYDDAGRVLWTDESDIWASSFSTEGPDLYREGLRAVFAAVQRFHAPGHPGEETLKSIHSLSVNGVWMSMETLKIFIDQGGTVLDLWHEDYPIWHEEADRKMDAIRQHFPRLAKAA